MEDWKIESTFLIEQPTLPNVSYQYVMWGWSVSFGMERETVSVRRTVMSWLTPQPICFTKHGIRQVEM